MLKSENYRHLVREAGSRLLLTTLALDSLMSHDPEGVRSRRSGVRVRVRYNMFGTVRSCVMSQGDPSADRLGKGG